MKKILFVNGHLNVGGVEKSLIDILKNINYEKYEVDLILFEDLGDYHEELPDGVNLIFIDLKKTYGSTFKCLQKALIDKNYFIFFMKIILTLSTKVNQKLLSLSKYLLKINKKYDCAIAFRVGFCAEIVSYCVNSKYKVVWWHHGECNYSSKIKKRMIKTFNYFNKVVVVSNGCKNMIENYFGGLNGKTVVIPNMVNSIQIYDKSQLFNPYKNENNIYKIVSVGRLSPEKNMCLIVYIVQELLKKEFNNFVWYIIGDGIEYKLLDDLINNQKLKNYIKLEGTRQNPYPYIYYADILVHTSLVESQCLTVLEALALSKPCIVAESIGPKEFIENGVNGILTSHNAKEIANQIIKLLKNRILLENIMINASKIVYNKYSVQVIMKLIEKILDGEE